MDFTKWMAGGALLGFVTMAWSHIKTFVQRFNNHFIQHVTIHDGVHEAVVVGWLRKNCRLSPAYEKRYELIVGWANNQWEAIPHETFMGRSLVFWYGWVPLYVTMPGKQINQARTGSETPSSSESRELELYCLRGTFDVERMIKEAAELKNQILADNRAQQVPRHRVVEMPSGAVTGGSVGLPSSGDEQWYTQQLVRLLQHSPAQLGQAGKQQKHALNALIFPERIQVLIEEIKRWANSAKWYEEKGLTWKHGWLIYGPPGTGKTALASAFAHDLNMPLWVFHLTRMSNETFLKSWHAMTSEAPCIVLFEDFDNVFHGRRYVGPQPLFSSMMMGPARRKRNNDALARFASNMSGTAEDDDYEDDSYVDDRALSFDTLLNCVDGAKRIDGIFLIITTNDISKIDPALGQLSSNGTLGTRPGRIDRVIELTYMELECMREMARRLLSEYPDLLEAALQWVEDNPDVKLTPAQWQNICGQKALARYWNADQDEERQAAGRFWESSYDKVTTEFEGDDATMADSAR